MMEFQEAECGVQVRALLERQGADVLVQLVGGDVPHYGVIVTVDRMGKVRSIALPSRPGHVHQETAIAEPFALRLHAALLPPGTRADTKPDAKLGVKSGVNEKSKEGEEGVTASPLASGNVMVASGVHVNAITPKQMRAVFRMCERLGERAADWLERHPVDALEEVFASSSDTGSERIGRE
ncbi:hypothetical protein JS532_08635 [Bifidobacterium callimiconis]|uniref:prenylated flavin chaperone LpdD n=1 Tax=Bifidobacterium callimiconis TaxID=2306973 RepID=UPI001BDC301A|nr:hypothetical protein [Bifidobacterium callimiconis]MBT1177622.1 hypothetical protein [Bifidobacterium callimiconis]